MKRKIIYHYPNPIKSDSSSASGIRPRIMRDTFISMGYEVYEISGYSKERRKLIKDVKRKIENGEIYDFLYSESLTLPTALSDKNHIPTFPMLDFSFFRFCRKHEIKVGVFYRDIYWRFPELYHPKTFIHKWIAKVFYYFDIVNYLTLDRIFLPSNEMKKYVPILPQEKLKELPPGTSDFFINNSIYKNHEDLVIVYVGGITDSYPMHTFLEAVRKCKFVNLIICTRYDEWKTFEQKNDIPSNVTVVHKNSNELKEVYEKADLCSLIFEHQEWRNFAFPFKFFEYLSYGKPVIVTSNTPAARLVQQYNLGWVVDYSEESIISMLEKIFSEKTNIVSVTKNILSARDAFSWEERVKYVAQELR